MDAAESRLRTSASSLHPCGQLPFPPAQLSWPPLKQTSVPAQDLVIPRGQTMLCVCFKPLHVWSSVVVKGWFSLPQKSLEATLAVGFLGGRLHQERQQQGPFRWQPAMSSFRELPATCQGVAAEAMLCVFAMTCEYQGPCTGWRCSSWASYSRVWLEAPEDQFTQAPGHFPTNSFSMCLVPLTMPRS